MKRLQHEAGVSYTTIIEARNGKPIGQYKVAKRISEATGGKVSIDELCDPDGHRGSA